MNFKSVLTFVLIYSVTLSAQWVKTNHPQSSMIRALAYSGNNIISGTFDGNMFITTDNGNSWNSINTGHTYSYFYSILINGQNIFIGTSNGVYLSSNNGSTWSLVNNGLLSSVSSFTMMNQKIYAGTGGGDIYATTDNGFEWKVIAKGLVTYSSITSLVTNGNNVFAGSDGPPGIYMSTDDGITWNPKNNGIDLTYIFTLARNENNIYAGTSGGVFQTTNNGDQWNKISEGMAIRIINILLEVNQNIFSGNDGGGVYLLPKGEQKWIAINDGLNNLNIRSLVVNNDFIFAGAYDGTVWRRPRTELITSIDDSQYELPTDFSLSQNYPNPFNPTTTIKYSIPNSQFVTLKVYDLLGREISTLVNEEKAPGNYEVKFDGSNLSSGVYLYRLQAGSFTQTKKFVLMK